MKIDTNTHICKHTQSDVHTHAHTHSLMFESFSGNVLMRHAAVNSFSRSVNKMRKISLQCVSTENQQYYRGFSTTVFCLTL